MQVDEVECRDHRSHFPACGEGRQPFPTSRRRQCMATNLIETGDPAVGRTIFCGARVSVICQVDVKAELGLRGSQACDDMRRAACRGIECLDDMEDSHRTLPQMHSVPGFRRLSRQLQQLARQVGNLPRTAHVCRPI